MEHIHHHSEESHTHHHEACDGHCHKYGEAGHHHHEHNQTGQLCKIGITIVLLIAAVIIEKHCELPTWQLLLIYLIPYLFIGFDTQLPDGATACIVSEANMNTRKANIS